jgi:hypothetical protein
MCDLIFKEEEGILFYRVGLPDEAPRAAIAMLRVYINMWCNKYN